MKKILVIGLGLFGRGLAINLAERGAEVIAVDVDMARLEQIQDRVAYAIRLDATDENALLALGLEDIEIAIVCIGEHFERNLLTSVHLKQAGVKMVVSRASDPVQAKVFKALGVDRVISPEQEAAKRTAISLLLPDVLELVSLGDGFASGKLIAPRKFVGKTLAEIELRPKYGLNLVAIYRTLRKGEAQVQEIIGNPRADTQILEGDLLSLIGREEHLQKLSGDHSP